MRYRQVGESGLTVSVVGLAGTILVAVSVPNKHAEWSMLLSTAV